MPAQAGVEDSSKQKVNLDKEKNLARNNYSYEKRQKELAKKKKKEDKAIVSEQKAALPPPPRKITTSKLLQELPSQRVDWTRRGCVNPAIAAATPVTQYVDITTSKVWISVNSPIEGIYCTSQQILEITISFHTTQTDIITKANSHTPTISSKIVEGALNLALVQNL